MRQSQPRGVGKVFRPGVSVSGTERDGFDCEGCRNRKRWDGVRTCKVTIKEHDVRRPSIHYLDSARNASWCVCISDVTRLFDWCVDGFRVWVRIHLVLFREEKHSAPRRGVICVSVFLNSRPAQIIMKLNVKFTITVNILYMMCTME